MRSFLTLRDCLQLHKIDRNYNAVIARVTTWSDGQTLTSSALNGEFNNIVNDYNSNITNANISATAAIATSKINATFPSGPIVGTTDSQTLTNKTLVAANNTLTNIHTVLDRSISTTTIANSLVETTMYTYAVPGNTLSTNKTIRVSMLGTFLQNGSGSSSFTINFKYGGTTIASKVFTIAQNAATYSYEIVCYLTAVNATNSQQGTLVGHASYGTSSVISLILGNGTAAIDSTASQNLVITNTNGGTDPNISFSKLSVITELL